MPIKPSSHDASDAAYGAPSPALIWLLHAGGVPLDAVGAQLSALDILGEPLACFDHGPLMFERTKQLGSRSFQSYIDAVMRNQPAQFSAFVQIADLPWLEDEPAIQGLLERRSAFVHLCFRDPVLQAVGLLAGSTSLPRADGLDGVWFEKIADAAMQLEQRETMARAWVARRGGQMVDLTVEDLAAPGVAALRHLLDRWSLALPKTARLHPLPPPNANHGAIAKAFRAEAERRHWGHAVPVRPPHWRRSVGR